MGTVKNHGSGLLILASTSPRRAKMLREAGYGFVQMKPPFEDPPQPAGLPGVSGASALAESLAARKAESLRDAGVFTAHPGATILAADTVCVGVDGSLIGQPADGADARRMIESFMEAEHEVVTGVALLRSGEGSARTFSDVAWVWMGRISPERLGDYVKSGDWRGKAGGYNLQDRVAEGWPIRVRGDQGTVMGLPMSRLAGALGAAPGDRGA